jgi:hypothetical protein
MAATTREHGTQWTANENDYHTAAAPARYSTIDSRLTRPWHQRVVPSVKMRKQSSGAQRPANKYASTAFSTSLKQRCTTPSPRLSCSSPETALPSERLEGKVSSEFLLLLRLQICLRLLISRIDSTVLAYVMKTLNERYQYGLSLFLLSIDEGITGYRDDSLQVRYQ